VTLTNDLVCSSLIFYHLAMGDMVVDSQNLIHHKLIMKPVSLKV
jgi:hypothetical protein